MPYWGQWLLCCGWRRWIKQGEEIWGQKLMSSTYSRMTGNRGDDLTCLYVIVKWRNRHFKFDLINIVDDNIIITSICLKSRACLKNAFCKMCITICGRFRLNEGGVAGYGNRMKTKYTVNWGVQIAGMIFQTRSRLFRIPRVQVLHFSPESFPHSSYW